jgi:hypothetical protein
VEATTSMAQLNLSFPTAPVDSTLHLKASTAMGAATVDLHPTYEGTFEISTNMAQARVEVVSESTSDPAGRDRSRNVEFANRMLWHAKGTASWSREGRGRGSVRVSSAMASVGLKL